MYRFICDETQQQDADVCFANTRQESLESGCFVHKLERPLCVCVSSDSVNRPSVEQDSAVQVSDSVNSTNVAETSVVSAATGVIDREAMLKQPRSSIRHGNPQMLKLHAWILSNDVGRRKVFLRQQPTEWLEHRKSLVRQYTKESGESSLVGVSNGRWIHCRYL